MTTRCIFRRGVEKSEQLTLFSRVGIFNSFECRTELGETGSSGSGGRDALDRGAHRACNERQRVERLCGGEGRPAGLRAGANALDRPRSSPETAGRLRTHISCCCAIVHCDSSLSYAPRVDMNGRLHGLLEVAGHLPKSSLASSSAPAVL